MIVRAPVARAYAHAPAPTVHIGLPNAIMAAAAQADAGAIAVHIGITDRVGITDRTVAQATPGAWWAWPRPMTLATYAAVYGLAATAILDSPAMRTATWSEWLAVSALLLGLFFPGRDYFVIEPRDPPD
jgi:hypothetical protein